MERVLICGDRNWIDYQAILNSLIEFGGDEAIECVIEGEANGADTLGRIAAQQLKISVLKFPADWQTHGKAAGPIRNQQQLVEGKPTICFAFHDDISKSKGTLDMINRCKMANVPVRLYYHEVKFRMY